MDAGASPVRPQRRECYCASRACGYGVSASYTMARYAAPDRVSASRNAQRLERDKTCNERITYLTLHPDLAMIALATAKSTLDEQAGEDRNSILRAAVTKREKIKAKRHAPAPISPPQKADTESLADLLELILDESRALVDRCRNDGADTITTKSAIDLHRNATSSRERFLNIATEADNQSDKVSVDVEASAVQIYTNMQRQLGDVPKPLPAQVMRPETTVADTRDEENLRYNIAVSLEQIEYLSVGKIPGLKDQIRLYETLLKSVVKLSQIINRSAVSARSTSETSGLKFDPSVVLRWAVENEIAR